MKKLTLALQREMKATIQDGTITIEIPDNCKMDLWQAQIEMWLEETDKPRYVHKYLRMKNNKLKLN